MEELMHDLPHSPSGMLHIFPPWLNTVIALILIGLILVILVWAVLYFFYQRRRQSPLPIAPRRPDRAAQEIDVIFNLYSKKQQYRAGCHELSSFLRRYYERLSGKEIEEMTAGEIMIALGRKNPGKLFFQLGFLQFRESDVTREEFEKICREARNAVHGAESNTGSAA